MSEMNNISCVDFDKFVGDSMFTQKELSDYLNAINWLEDIPCDALNNVCRINCSASELKNELKLRINIYYNKVLTAAVQELLQHYEPEAPFEDISSIERFPHFLHPNANAIVEIGEL